jgi:hypothetical protein
MIEAGVLTDSHVRHFIFLRRAPDPALDLGSLVVARPAFDLATDLRPDVTCPCSPTSSPQL